MLDVSKDELGMNHVKAYVTELADSMGYCEYKIPFYAKGDYVKTEAMIIGGQFHKEAEDFERETAITEPLTKMELETKTEDIEFVREDISTIFTHDFNFLLDVEVLQFNHMVCLSPQPDQFILVIHGDVVECHVDVNIVWDISMEFTLSHWSILLMDLF